MLAKMNGLQVVKRSQFHQRDACEDHSVSDYERERIDTGKENENESHWRFIDLMIFCN